LGAKIGSAQRKARRRWPRRRAFRQALTPAATPAKNNLASIGAFFGRRQIQRRDPNVGNPPNFASFLE